MKVLIFDDSAEKIKEISSVLISTGLVTDGDLDVVGDANSARRAVSEVQYELLVLDLVAPERLGEAVSETAGLRLLEELSDAYSERTPGTIIALTEYAEIELRARADFEARGVLLVRYSRNGTLWQTALSSCIRRIGAAIRGAQESRDEFGSDVGIVCALDLELSAIERFSGWQWSDISIPGDPTLYLETTIEHPGRKRRVVAGVASRMGMSAASALTTRLLNAFRPKYLVMPGITAAVRGRAVIGDLIAADECWDWGMGKWITDDDGRKFVAGPHHIALDSDLRGVLQRLSRKTEFLKLIHESWPASKPREVPSILIGPVASGSAVIASQQMSDHIASQHRKLIGIEMEAYGVYLAASESLSPRPKTVMLKSVCDFADDQKNDDWQHYAAFVSASAVKSLILELLQ